MKLMVPLRNQQVEIPLLWRLVASLGGSQAVTQLSLWPTIAEQLLNVSSTNTVRFQTTLQGLLLYLQLEHKPLTLPCYGD